MLLRFPSSHVRGPQLHRLTTIAGDIPSLKLFESSSVFAFLDIQPLSVGHAVRSAIAAYLVPRNQARKGLRRHVS